MSSSSSAPEPQDATQFIAQSGSLTSDPFRTACIAVSDNIILLNSTKDFASGSRIQIINLDQTVPEGKSYTGPSLGSILSFCLNEDGSLLALYNPKNHTIIICPVESLKTNVQNIMGKNAELKVPPTQFANVGMFFIGANIVLSLQESFDTSISITNLKSGKQTNFRLSGTNFFCPFGSDAFISTKDRLRGIFIHPIQFGPQGEVKAVDQQGVNILSGDECDYGSVAVSKSHKIIAAHCQYYRRGEFLIKRFDIERDEKSASGYRLKETGKFVSDLYRRRHFFNCDDWLVFPNPDEQLCVVAPDSNTPQIIDATRQYAPSCAMPGGNVLRITADKFDIHAMSGAILQQALIEIVHQIEVTNLPGKFSRPIGALVSEFSADTRDVSFFSRPQKQLIQYNEAGPENEIVKSVLAKYLKHPLISWTDKQSIQAFLRQTGSLNKCIDAALNFPGISQGAQNFWEDFKVIFGQTKKPTP